MYGNECGGFQIQKPLLRMVAFRARVETSLHSSPMLWFNCPILASNYNPAKLLIPPLQHTYTPVT